MGERGQTYVRSPDNEESRQIKPIISDIVNIGLHFILKNVRPYAASCSEA